jgi:hypothetical protein
MQTLRLTRCAAVTALLLGLAAPHAHATTILITATLADRGIDIFPWDGVNASVFGNPSVVQITTPPIGSQAASEERTAVEFALSALPANSIIDSVMLRLTPAGQSLNIGLSAGEVSEVHGYAGDGVIQVADLMDSLAVASLAGPTANGAVTVSLALNWFQALADSNSGFAGLMFKGVPGPMAVVYSFDSAFGGVPVGDRPTLIVDYHAAVVPEPGALLLFGAGMLAFGHRMRARQRGRSHR